MSPGSLNKRPAEGEPNGAPPAKRLAPDVLERKKKQIRDVIPMIKAGNFDLTETAINSLKDRVAQTRDLELFLEVDDLCLDIKDASRPAPPVPLPTLAAPPATSRRASKAGAIPNPQQGTVAPASPPHAPGEDTPAVPEHAPRSESLTPQAGEPVVGPRTSSPATIATDAIANNQHTNTPNPTNAIPSPPITKPLGAPSANNAPSAHNTPSASKRGSMAETKPQESLKKEPTSPQQHLQAPTRGELTSILSGKDMLFWLGDPAACTLSIIVSRAAREGNVMPFAEDIMRHLGLDQSNRYMAPSLSDALAVLFSAYNNLTGKRN